MNVQNFEMNDHNFKGKEEIVNRKGKILSPARISAGAESKHIISTMIKYLEKAKKLRLSVNVKARQPNTFPFQSRDEKER